MGIHEESRRLDQFIGTKIMGVLMCKMPAGRKDSPAFREKLVNRILSEIMPSINDLQRQVNSAHAAFGLQMEDMENLRDELRRTKENLAITERALEAAQDRLRFNSIASQIKRIRPAGAATGRLVQWGRA